MNKKILSEINRVKQLISYSKGGLLNEQVSNYTTLDQLIKAIPELVKGNEEDFVAKSKDILAKNGLRIEEDFAGENAIKISTFDRKISKSFTYTRAGGSSKYANEIIDFINKNKSTRSLYRTSYNSLNDYISDLHRLVKLSGSEFVTASTKILTDNGFSIRKYAVYNDRINIGFGRESEMFVINRENSQLNNLVVKSIIDFIRKHKPDLKDTGSQLPSTMIPGQQSGWQSQLPPSKFNQNPSAAPENNKPDNKPNKTNPPKKNNYKLPDAQGVYSRPNDPYKYKVIDGVWYTIGGKLNSWTSLKNKKDANDTLDRDFPNARANTSKSTGDSTKPPTPTPFRYDPDSPMDYYPPEDYNPKVNYSGYNPYDYPDYE
jgi:hypothetical protein